MRTPLRFNFHLAKISIDLSSAKFLLVLLGHVPPAVLCPLMLKTALLPAIFFHVKK